ncbi:MAG: ChaB family protein [Microcoleus vaginatus WJT46-NPBG5]|jgi:cation transport regulator|nr:ChaB family protein [Microcoleus vaginatus WJT46-NPBG5]
MADTQQVKELPAELKDQMLEGSQQIYLAALNSAMSNGMDEDAARRVAMNTVEHDYQKGDDGKWHRRPQQSNQTRKSIQSGGN